MHSIKETQIMQTQILVQWKNLELKFQNHCLFPAFDGQINSGQKLAIIGANGCGKSSFLKLLLGFINLSAQTEIYWQIDLKNLSYVPQNIDFDFQPPLSVSEFLNVCKTTNIWNWPQLNSKLKYETTENDPWDIKKLQNYKLQQLSRGQIQKITLVRAYLQEPQLVLLDEPLNGLDKKNRLELLTLIFSQVQSLAMVIHDADWINFGFTHVLELDTGSKPKIITISDYKVEHKQRPQHV